VSLTHKSWTRLLLLLRNYAPGDLFVPSSHPTTNAVILTIAQPVSITMDTVCCSILFFVTKGTRERNADVTFSLGRWSNYFALLKTAG
jgi:hypothetical protein